MRLLSICALAVISLLTACSRKQEDAAASELPETKSAPVVRVAPVRTTALPDEEFIAPAHVETNPNRVTHVVLPLPGRIVSVLVRMGDAVKEGQPLLEIESPDAEEAESAYLQAEAALNHDNAVVSKAQADLDRLSDLFQHGAVARKDVLAAENALTLAKASLSQTAAGRERAKRRLELLGLQPGQTHQRVVVKSPISGKVLVIQVVAGEYRNDTNANVLTIADLSTLWMVSDVPESAIRFCKIGGAVEIELIAYPGEVFHGRVTQIADTLDPETRTIKVRAEFQNKSGRFRPEMFGRLRYFTGAQQGVVAPESAVIHSSDKTFVYRETEPGHYTATEVTLGKRIDDGFAVLSGLRPGDRIVTEGAIYLKAGI